MSLCQPGCHSFSQCYAACFNQLQTLKLHRHRLLMCQTLSFFLPAFLPLIFNMKFMRRKEGLIKESRGAIIKHLRSLLCVAEPFLPSFFRTQQRPSLQLPRSRSVLQGSDGILKLRERGESYQLLRATTLFLLAIHSCPLHLGRLRLSSKS